MKLASEFEEVPQALPEAGTGWEKRFDEFSSRNESAQNWPEPLRRFFGTVFELSPHLRSSALKETAFCNELLEHGFEQVAEGLLEETRLMGRETATESQIMEQLRIAKRRTSLLCGLADLGCWWSGAEVTRALSAFADASLTAAIDFILLRQHEAGKLELENPEQPQKDCGLVVLGMGKLGASELNYSSDIDIILFYEPGRGMDLKTDDPVTLLSRMARQLVKIMQERTADGYVFRTDLRLRPDPSSTPLVIPVVAALNYYEGQGQNWERAAMIKARAISGDIASGEQFLAELAPFVWRKYLDFAAINDIHSIKRQIHTHKGHGEIRVLGHNVKLGRGGIREIEFFVQTQQLIAGGRNLALRTNKTIEALHELAELGWIEHSAASEMAEAYWFLRNVEHRLQMVSDEQTHTLPDNDKELLRIARMSGFDSVKKFSKKLGDTLRRVAGHYGELFESSEALASDEGSLVFTGDEPDPETINTLERLGYKNPEAAMRTVKNWHVAKIPALRTTRAREMLTELVPSLLSAFSRTDQPDETLILFDRFVSGLPAGIQLFSILQNNQGLATLILKLLTSAPRLARQISSQPHVFDAMLDPSFVNDKADHADLLERISILLDRAPDYESALDAGRRFFQEASFLYGSQFFSGILSLEQVKNAYSVLGDVMVSAMYDCVIKEFAKRHGRVQGARVCILGMGRLGSRELTATSDLDLIFLYDYDPENDTSDGQKPLHAQQYFTRLMQRFIAAMSSPTSEGIIYNLDFRLRPSGNAGPLATPVEGFLRYQKEEAWVWEAQSLTRGRPVAGDAELMEAIATEIPLILGLKTSRPDLAVDIRDMRERIEREKGDKGVWDVKTAPGGLLDIEFLAQWFVLRGLAPNSVTTRKVIESVPDSELGAEVRGTLLEALEAYEKVLHFQRICLGEDADPEGAPSGYLSALCVMFDQPDINTCTAYLADKQKEVRSAFSKLLG
ncbi:MAG: bifunctional [glutamine synthetase] adenylyltransferase/[glutamine synthetase]-adenylyl-L-tyrosine phosphorylase [Rhizobiaceae bacterium]|nr:bifunctional [glutamine synthetase] adenylyltransferase/[glutamine synthetase]-adenylyl-L-tyrosine phosphorylase [Rhizobiaceae bacterium]